MRNNGSGQAQHPPTVDYDEVARMRQSLRDIHEKTSSWRFVGQVIGRTGAYARMIANEEREPTKAVITQWRKYVKTTGKPPRSRRRYYRPCLSLELRDELERRGANPETLLWLAMKISDKATIP